MQTGILHLHSTLPYLLLAGWGLLLILSLVNAKKTFGKFPRVLWRISLGLTHLQFLAGLVLYFLSSRGYPAISEAGMGEVMKTPELRFFVVEHLSTMIFAVVLLTVGSAKVKRAANDAQAWRRTLIFVALGLILLLARIPWDQWPAA